MAIISLQKFATSQLKKKFSRVPKALANQIKTINDFARLARIIFLFGGTKNLQDAEKHVNTVLADTYSLSTNNK
ncbi:MAG: hypothetical protein LBR22_09190 [Desulfovibrio sp.]|jgi:hypothetical protein|nr:hypothetical protein [Desulfovibrio sp.]